MKKLFTAIVLFLTLASFALAVDQTVPPVSTGKSVTFTVTCTGTPPFTYQWYKDGVAIVTSTNQTMTGLTGSVLAFTYAPTDAGTYTVKITNSAGSLMSDKVILSSNLAPASISITVGVVDKTTVAGGTTTAALAAPTTTK